MNKAAAFFIGLALAAGALSPASATTEQALALQDYDLPPVVYIQNPETLDNDQALVELYTLYPSAKAGAENPTRIGQALLELLERTPERQVRRITKMKFYMLLKALSDYTLRQADPRYQANPELLTSYKKRIDDIMAREEEKDHDSAGLGKSDESLRETLRQRQAVLRRALALMEQAGGPDKPDAAFAKRLDAELSTLQMDGSGEALIPSTLMLMVKAIPESDLTQKQWRTLFESYPMGKSLWESRVDKLWRQTLDGSGMTVAVLDTGIDKAHPFFQGGVFDGANFTAHRYIDHDHKDAEGHDLFGQPNHTGNHGTHVASTVRAYAPGARIVNVKVLDEEVSEQIPPELQHDNMMTLAAIKNGLQSVYEHNKAVAEGRENEPRVDMVSMSLGITGSTGVFDPANPDELSAWVRKLSEQGVVVVVAAGNEGVNSLRRPSLAPEAITVGAVDYFDRITEFSSSNAVLEQPKGAVSEKPDIWAYGHNVEAAKFDPATNYAKSAPQDLSARMSGTSMATPHVSGMTLLLMQEARRSGVELSPATLKNILQKTAAPIANGNAFSRASAGVIDVNAALAYLKERLAALKALAGGEASSVKSS